MSTFKKLLALSLALAMVLSFSAFAADYKDDTYKDAANIDEDCADAVELMYALDIMKGDQNSNFNPTGSITRAEIAKMIYVVLNKGKDDQAVNFKYNTMFSDVPGDAWYAGYVNYCAATKLIDGFNGKFLPLQPVTTAQAAKMLLTAIGYSSQDRQYTGANWEKNVLSDAAIVGLLEDYNWPTNQTAPRQWIAVMFENMLLNAYTYGTARPGTINGLLTGSMGELGWGQEAITMGEKYFYLRDKTAYLYATDCAYIDTVTEESDQPGAGKPRTNNLANGDSGYDAIFASSDSDTHWIHVKNAGLGYMDLGQQYRVIWNTDNKKVYSVRNTGTSVVGDAMLKDMESETKRSTDTNDAWNRYFFTIGDLTAPFADSSINALELDTRESAKDMLNTNYKPTTLDKIVGDLKADDYRAIDRNGNGKIDYLIIKEYTYGQVTKVGTHRDYGEYFNAITPVKGDADGTADYKVLGYGDKNITNWYIEDVVNSETAIEKDNAIKVCYNPDKDLYDVEVLPVNTGDYTKRTQNQKKAHTIGGEEYFAAEDGFENPYISLISQNLKDELTFAYDDNLVVLVGQEVSNITDLDDINSQLVLVVNAYIDVYSNDYHRCYVDYMTIDGEIHEEVRYSGNADYSINFYDLMSAGTKLAENELLQNADPTADLYTREYLDHHQRLFKLVEHDNGTISLIRLLDDKDEDKVADKDWSQKRLDYADSLLTGYEEDDGTLNTEKATFAHGETDFVNESNKFFVSFKDSDGADWQRGIGFAVMTLDELGEGKDDNAYIQGLYYTRRSTKTHLAGHIYQDLDLADATGYLYTTDDGAFEIDDGEWYLGGVVFQDGKEAEDVIRVLTVDGEKVRDEDDIEPNRLYSYTYKKSKDELQYNLTLIDEKDPHQDKVGKETFRFDFTYGKDTGIFDEDDSNRIVDSELYNIIAKTKDIITTGDTTFQLKSDAVIALKTVTLDRDETQVAGWGEDGEKIYGFDVSEKIEFISFNDLIEEEDGVSVNHIYDNDKDQNNDTYEYYTDLYWKVNDDGKGVALYVVVYEVMVEANWE